MIFSTLQLMAYLRLNIVFLSLGVGFIYELNVIFDRFASIFNIKNIQMVKIDPIDKNSFQ